MAATAEQMIARARKEREPPKKRKPRIIYRVTLEPGGDPEKGEELLRRWLAEVLSESEG